MSEYGSSPGYRHILLFTSLHGWIHLINSLPVWLVSLGQASGKKRQTNVKHKFPINMYWSHIEVRLFSLLPASHSQYLSNRPCSILSLLYSVDYTLTIRGVIFFSKVKENPQQLHVWFSELSGIFQHKSKPKSITQWHRIRLPLQW